jgi:hypothetical protein
MTIQAVSATGRTASYQRGSAAHPARTNPATLIALMLFLIVLIPEVVFLAINAPSAADLGALTAVAGNVP